jgi:hypothetical protein
VIADVGPGGTVMSGGYLNLAAQAGMSRVRDKSTCVYHLLVLPTPPLTDHCHIRLSWSHAGGEVHDLPRRLNSL